jgi:DMSO/TMAO reductase YedYZ molybdopterin-dependent catalytic subunit
VVEGDAVAHPLALTYEEILKLPSRTVFSYLECAGNQRSMFELVNGQATVGTAWMAGGVGNGEWTGVAMRDVLALASLKENAVDVLCIGLDNDAPEEGFRRVLPIEKAMDPDTLLAYALNGEKLPRDHGYPLRVVAPGWAASSSIKWLGRIVVSSHKLWTRNNTTAYVLVGGTYPPEGEAPGMVITTQNIKSALALPWPAELPAGRQRLYGFAHSPVGAIAQVEWSSDGGATWQQAALVSPQVQYSWVRFEFWWDAKPGEHTVRTRATDAQGNTQPAQISFNAEGYLFNQPLPHPIHVR